MAECYLFDIPIYWCSQEKFNTDYAKRLKTHIEEFEINSGYPLTESLRISLEDSFWRSYIAPWRFNQIVGWLRIYKLGTQIRGELWYMNAKRAGRQLTKKQFSLKGKAFEIRVYPNETSAEVYSNLLGDIESFARTLRRNEVLELQPFKELAPFVNWRELVCSRPGA